jgi:hypothetical protein
MSHRPAASIAPAALADWPSEPRRRRVALGTLTADHDRSLRFFDGG